VKHLDRVGEQIEEGAVGVGKEATQLSGVLLRLKDDAEGIDV